MKTAASIASQNRRKFHSMCFLLVLLQALVSPQSDAWAQSHATEHVLQLDNGNPPLKAKLEQFDWLVGRWVGEGLGGDCEEVFLPPWNGSMTGSFRYARDGKLIFSEFFSLVSEGDDGLVLRLKHFHPDLHGWEEKDEFVEFPLIRLEPKAAYFGGLSYRLSDDGKLHVWVAMRSEGKPIREEGFVFRRATLDSKD